MTESTNDLGAQLSEQLAGREWGLFGGQGFALGVDMGSYGLRAVLAQLSGEQCHQRAAEVRPEASAPEMLAETIELVGQLLQQAGVGSESLIRVGVGFGGPVDRRSGAPVRSHRMEGWAGVPVRQRFEEAFGAPVLVDNDANAIALGEATFGVGRQAPNLFYLHLSRGVGGGVVLNHKLYHGPRMLAGEIGHAPMGPDGPPCRCGGRGHLESYLSIDGLLRRAGELGLATQDLRDVFGDGDAGRKTVAEAVQLLGLELARVVQLLDPDLLVLGGIVTRLGGEGFVGAVQEAVAGHKPPTVEHQTPVVASSFGYDAVAIGGLALALESLSS